MKKTFLTPLIVLFFIVLSLTIIFGCRKTFYSNRLEKAWKVDSYFKNGVDSTSNFDIVFKDYVIEFYDNYGYKETYNTLLNQGTWTLTNKSKTLQLTNNGVVKEYNITKIKDKSLYLVRSETGEEFHFSPK